MDRIEFKYFRAKEFDCKCGCKLNNSSEKLVHMLGEAREKAGVPFVLNSACRCETHNQAVGGKADSSHLKGLAVDIRVASSGARHAIIRGLILAGFKRIGVGALFVHADVDAGKPQGVVWLY